MTTEEFSSGFDVYMNSYSQSLGDPFVMGGLNFDEYEKSLFLTEAQEQFVKALYKGAYNNDSFEETEELRRQLDCLVAQHKYTADDNVSESVAPISDGKKHTVFKLDDDCWYIIYENAINGSDESCLGGMSSDVVPTPHDIYNRTRNNPFRGPNNNRVLRLDRGNNYVELVSSFPIGTYIVRYLKRPDPIILVSLQGTGLSINNKQEEATCKLNDVVHRNILELAVKLAYASRSIGTTSTSKKNKDSDDD